MSPTAPSLAQSESKARFFDRLYLNEGNKMHRFLYSLMKAEAVEGWERMTADRSSLAREFREDPKVEPPFTFGQIDESALRREIVRIYNNARPDTKIMYGLGQHRDADVEQNWIIRWLLWHVFRYRDDRNVTVSKRGGKGRGEEEGGAILRMPVVFDGESTVQVAADATRRAIDGVDRRVELRPPGSGRYDPVRDEFR